MRPTLHLRKSQTLLVDLKGTQGEELAKQLRAAGFQTDLVTGAEDAEASLRAVYYHSCILLADLDHEQELELIARLRRAATRVWILLLCGPADERERLRALRRGADAVLPAPYLMVDLASRLAAFSLRSRPGSEDQ